MGAVAMYSIATAHAFLAHNVLSAREGTPMKPAIVSAAVAMLIAGSAHAADSPQPSKGTGPNVERIRAEILKRIDARIARNQEEKSCVQAAKTPEEIRTCQQKFRAEMKRPEKK
jgi:hypothetical protein